MHETGLSSCPVAGFGVNSDDKLSVYTIGELVNYLVTFIIKTAHFIHVHDSSLHRLLQKAVQELDFIVVMASCFYFGSLSPLT